jgi:hypothetical protein
MNRKGILSSAYNMSLGYTPVVISIILCEFITQDTAIYIGTGIGMLYSYYSMHRRGVRVPNFILYISTFMLMLLTLAALIPGDYVPAGALPLTLEVSILIPMLSLYLHRRRFINHFLKKQENCNKRMFAQGAESAIVSAHIILPLGILHFIIISLAVFFSHPIGETTTWIIFSFMPPAIFILCIILNQIGIHYFNRLMSHTEYVPIVNTQGDVIGKTIAIEALNYKNTYINPVIRIAVSSHGKLFLCSRPQTAILDKGKTDIPMECYLSYGESLAEGCQRMLRNAFPKADGLKPTFSIMYHFENSVTNRLVYLFILDVENDSILCSPHFKGGKLWQFQQIEQNLGRKFFSACFEEEYEHLKNVIGIREKYKDF